MEKNLLTDVALALHSGISVNDLLKDLVGQTAGNLVNELNDCIGDNLEDKLLV